jgi:hypothetical protein
LEIVLSIVFGVVAIREGRGQSKVLDHMDQSAAATTEAMKAARDSLKSLAESQAASLKILQEQEAERGKKPRFVLYMGNVPVTKASLRLVPMVGQDTRLQGNLELALKNDGEASANSFALIILEPEDVNAIVFSLSGLPEFGEPSTPKMRRIAYQVPFMHVGDVVHLRGSVQTPKHHPSFKLTFAVSTTQLPVDVPLGSLTVLPPKP